MTVADKTLIVFFSMWDSKDGSAKSGDIWIVTESGKQHFPSISKAREYAAERGCKIKTRCV